MAAQPRAAHFAVAGLEICQFNGLSLLRDPTTSVLPADSGAIHGRAGWPPIVATLS
jgi:hypothetical protein